MSNSDIEYATDYTYQYDSNKRPLRKDYTLVQTKGDGAGSTFSDFTEYSYY